MNINYQKKLDALLASLCESGEPPALLLHSCCAPCSSYVLEYLSGYFRITVFYYNPNLYPQDEYDRRSEEQKRLISVMPFKNKVDFIGGACESGRFFDVVRGLENEKEGGGRCEKCYRLRLEETARLAAGTGFDYFATTLSLSPLKDAAKINGIGEKLSRQYGVSYLSSDFKKKNGYKRSVELSKQYGLYRQNYCGCVFSVKTPVE